MDGYCFALRHNEPQLLLLPNTHKINMLCIWSRGKRFEVFNTHGCTCSIDHLKNHGAFWANKHKAVEELDKTRPWRISIDNLNLHIKFAKNLPGSSNGAKKMLNLITGQVTTRTSEKSKRLKTESLTAMVQTRRYL